MYGWLLRGKGFSGDVGMVSVAAMSAASGKPPMGRVA
jgi:hypothetical protein